MYCIKCNSPLSSCSCPDIEERLAEIGASGHVILTFCSGCGSHVARCKCPHPKPPLEQRLKGKICGVIPRRYARIENWSLVNDPDPYKPPEVQSVRLQGDIYEDSRFEAGDFVTTSPIERVDGEYAVTRNGTFYKLGEVSADYEKAYPGAKERFLKAGAAK